MLNMHEFISCDDFTVNMNADPYMRNRPMRSSPQKAADGLLTGAAGMTRAKQEESFRRRNSVGVCTIYVHICIDIFI